LSFKRKSKEEESIIFDVSIAEVICKKDTSDLIQKAIGEPLEKGLKHIVESSLPIGYDREGKLQCRFGQGDDLRKRMTVRKEVYVTGDLAFYAMVLRRESSSGTKCFLCRQSLSEFAASLSKGEAWTYDLMNQFVADMADGKPIKGCKEHAWWQMIPLDHYLVPLLHALISIGNDVYNNFRDIVNQDIEQLVQQEVTTRAKVVACEAKIAKDVMQRNAWDALSKGKELDSLKGMVYRRKVGLKKLSVVASTLSRSVEKRSVIGELLDEIEENVERGDIEGTDNGSSSDDNTADETGELSYTLYTVSDSAANCNTVNSHDKCNN
jgi:hypothetical protein